MSLKDKIPAAGSIRSQPCPPSWLVQASSLIERGKWISGRKRLRGLTRVHKNPPYPPSSLEVSRPSASDDLVLSPGILFSPFYTWHSSLLAIRHPFLCSGLAKKAGLRLRETHLKLSVPGRIHATRSAFAHPCPCARVHTKRKSNPRFLTPFPPCKPVVKAYPRHRT